MSHDFARPRGQGEPFDRLVSQARALHMHHGLLLTGPTGIGKSMAADYIANALLCSGAAPDAPCGSCPPCDHIANHPDLLRVEIPEEKDEIPVEFVRDLARALQRHSVEGRARVVIIDPADRLNVQGQNALLKTLEEPGSNTFLLLPTARPEALLDTVRSRVASLRLLPLSEAEIDATLVADGVGDGELRGFATAHSEGALGWARRLADGELRPVFALLEGYLTGARGTPVSVARAALEGASGRVATVERAMLVLWILRTILRKDLGRVVAADAPGPYFAATSVRWTTKIESLFDAESDLALRIPPEQVLVRALASVAS